MKPTNLGMNPGFKRLLKITNHMGCGLLGPSYFNLLSFWLGQPPLLLIYGLTPKLNLSYFGLTPNGPRAPLWASRFHVHSCMQLGHVYTKVNRSWFENLQFSLVESITSSHFRLCESIFRPHFIHLQWMKNWHGMLYVSMHSWGFGWEGHFFWILLLWCYWGQHVNFINCILFDGSGWMGMWLSMEVPKMLETSSCSRVSFALVLH